VALAKLGALAMLPRSNSNDGRALGSLNGESMFFERTVYCQGYVKRI